ncbi:MAG: hypothetical protein Q4A66_09630 [Eubacteriales bacterium]|nr:hypothetical protein [Eubacteriales bacterium]
MSEAYDPVYGARPLRRYLSRHVETLLAREMIAGNVAPHADICVDVENGALLLRFQ